MISTASYALKKDDIMYVFEPDSVQAEVFKCTEENEECTLMSIQEARVLYRKLLSIGYIVTEDY